MHAARLANLYLVFERLDRDLHFGPMVMMDPGELRELKVKAETAFDEWKAAYESADRKLQLAAMSLIGEYHVNSRMRLRAKHYLNPPEETS